MFRPLYAGTPNYAQHQEWIGHVQTTTMDARVAAFVNNIMTGQDPITPATEGSKGWYDFLKVFGIYDNSLVTK